MGNRIRSCLVVGVAMATAVAVAVLPPQSDRRSGPAATPTASVRVLSTPVQLTAAVEQAAQPTALPNLLVDWFERIVIPPSAGQPIPQPDFPPVVGGTSIGSAIINTYNAIEPWVQYGFELATYAVGWVPYVGWLSGQIMIFYFFGERITRSIAYNVAYWLDGNISFGQGLINVAIDTINSFIQLGIDQWNFWLPPLPPLPPFPLAAEPGTAETTAMSAEEGAEEFPAVDSKESESTETPPQEPPVQRLMVDEPAVEQTVTDGEEPSTEEPTTDTLGAVSAQGEVRAPVTAPEEDPADTALSTENDTTQVEELEEEVGNPTEFAEAPSSVDDASGSTPSEVDGESGVE